MKRETVHERVMRSDWELSRRAPQRFDAGIGADGKVAVGRWDRIMTLGEKQKDGQPADFTPENLQAFVRNWYARGGRLPMCLDHASALGGAVPAPAAAFYDALAVVVDGQVQDFKALRGSAAAAPDVEQLRQQCAKYATEDLDDDFADGALTAEQVQAITSPDGLWAWRCAVTPLGQHPTQGLANYEGLSPLFTMDGRDEQGNSIGPVLYDVAAVNVNFQAGCELAAGRIGGPGAMQMATLRDRNGTELHVGDVVTGTDGSRYVITEIDTTHAAPFAITKNLRTGASGWDGGKSLQRASDQTRGTGEIKGMSARVGAGTQQMAQMIQVHDATVTEGQKVYVVRNGKVEDEGTVVSGNGAWIEVRSSTTGRVDEWPIGDVYRYPHRMSALGGAGATSMNEMMMKLGLAADCAPSDKMAAYMKHAMGAATDDEIKMMAAEIDSMDEAGAKGMAAKMRKMAGEMPPAAAMAAPFEGKETPEEEKAEAAAMSALAVKMGLDPKMPRAQLLAALNAGAVPMAALPGLVKKEVDAALAADRTARAEQERADKLGAEAVAGGYPESDKAALVAFARVNPAAAQKLAQPFIDKAATLFTRFTSGGAPLGKPQRGSAVPSVVEGKGTIRFGMDLAAAVKAKRAASPTLSYEAATEQVIAEHPEMVSNYYSVQR